MHRQIRNIIPRGQRAITAACSQHHGAMAGIRPTLERLAKSAGAGHLGENAVQVSSTRDSSVREDRIGERQCRLRSQASSLPGQAWRQRPPSASKAESQRARLGVVSSYQLDASSPCRLIAPAHEEPRRPQQYMPALAVPSRTRPYAAIGRMIGGALRGRRIVFVSITRRHPIGKKSSKLVTQPTSRLRKDPRH